MKKTILATGLVLAAVAAAMPALTQTPPVRVRGAIESVDGQMLTVKTRDGADVKIKLADNAPVRSVAKASLEASVRYLAADLGPSNIRVNTISAGAVKTTSARGIRDFSKMLEGGAKVAPLRRTTDPAEVDDTAVFLASDLGRGVTGNTLFVDAGYQLMG